MTASDAPAIDKGPTFDVGGFVVAACFIGDVALFATGEGEVVAATRAVGVEGRDKVHADGLLFACPAVDGKSLVTAGDDGRIRRVTLTQAEDIHDTAGKWPTALATGPDGAVAVGLGRKIVVVRPGKPSVTLDAPSLVSGLAFAPKGFRLAAAHNGGVTLWYPGQKEAQPTKLDWKGSHLDVTFSPDGAFLVTSMQENALHGWRLADKGHMRMTGYPGKTRSFSWSLKGKWLATSGADASILWPFQDKDGPMGKAPKEMAVRANTPVTRVACHPGADVLATGFADGMVLLTRLTDLAEIPAALPMGAPVSALAWSSDGAYLAWGTETGRAGIFPARQSD